MDPGTRDPVVRACEEARVAWPRIQIPGEVFASWVVDRLDPSLDPAGAVAALHVADLYVACGCARGDPAAVEVLDRDFIPEVRAALGATGADQTSIAEAEQRLRARMLVTAGSSPPPIAQYNGRGRLRAFLGVAGVRELLQMRRSVWRERPARDEEIGAIVAPDDPEIEYLKRYYRRELAESFAEASATLTPKQRNILRYALVEGMTHAEIATIYGLPRATLRHQLEKARELMLTATRRAMRRRLQISRSEFESIVRLVKSQVHLSLGAAGPSVE
jgi:RNA polymerase sigma-70 factor (ECF subfamily)